MNIHVFIHFFFFYQQVERMMKKMALETQLHEAKMTKLRVEFEAEKELLLREKQQLLVVSNLQLLLFIICHELTDSVL